MVVAKLMNHSGKLLDAVDVGGMVGTSSEMAPSEAVVLEAITGLSKYLLMNSGTGALVRALTSYNKSWKSMAAERKMARKAEGCLTEEKFCKETRF